MRLLEYRARLGVAAALLMLAGTFGTQSASASSHIRAGTYEMKRPTLAVTLVVRGQEIVHTNVQATERCTKKDYVQAGGFSLNGPTIPIHHGGRIVYLDRGNGFFENNLYGRFSQGRITGIYRAWTEEFNSNPEEPGEPGYTGEHTGKGEDYRCGTIEPHGRFMHFSAQRLRGGS
jgi:hypothetical protein